MTKRGSQPPRQPQDQAGRPQGPGRGRATKAHSITLPAFEGAHINPARERVSAGSWSAGRRKRLGRNESLLSGESGF